MSKRNNDSNESQTKQQESNAASNVPTYLSAALRIPSSFPLGAKTVDDAVVETSVKHKRITPIPGVMVLNYVPTMGYSDGPTSPVNRAVFEQFNLIRSQISGNRPYEPADHMIYRMAVDSLRELYMYVKRIYAIIRHYSATNLYRPKAMLSAMGLDADDWYNNAAQLYQWLHTNANSLIPFPTVPIGNVTKRREIFNSAFFTDGDIDSTQTYIFNQRYFWSYELVDEVKGLTPMGIPNKFADFVVMWNRMYSALQNSSDVYIIAADIRRAFGDSVVNTLTAPAPDEAIAYVKLDSMLTAIMNAEICPTLSAGDIQSFRITDEGGIIKCTPHISMVPGSSEVQLSCIAAVPHYSHINLVSPTASEGDVIMATRYKNITKWQNKCWQLTSFGFEVIVGATMLTRPEDVGLDEYRFTFFSGALIPGSDMENMDNGVISSTTLTKLIKFMADISNFDWHPPIAICSPSVITTQGEGENMKYEEAYTDINAYIIEDIQNYIPMSENNLKIIQDATLLAEFGF